MMSLQSNEYIRHALSRPYPILPIVNEIGDVASLNNFSKSKFEWISWHFYRSEPKECFVRALHHLLFQRAFVDPWATHHIRIPHEKKRLADRSTLSICVGDLQPAVKIEGGGDDR